MQQHHVFTVSRSSAHAAHAHSTRACLHTQKLLSLSSRAHRADDRAIYAHAIVVPPPCTQRILSRTKCSASRCYDIDVSHGIYALVYMQTAQCFSLSLCLETPRGASSRSKDRFNPRAAATANKQGPIGVCLPSVIRADK